MAKCMNDWIKNTNLQRNRRYDSSTDTSLQLEKDNFILENQTANSYWEDSIVPEPFKSNFARKLSISTPTTQRLAPLAGSTPTSTPKRARSPDDEDNLLDGVKALKADQVSE